MTDLRSFRRATFPALLIFACFSIISCGPFGKDKSAENIKVDNTPVTVPAGPAITSFAPIVKKVSPSVVSVFTTHKVHTSVNPMNPMFNDPFFRRFFGDPDGNDGNGDSHGPHLQPHGQTQTGLGSGVIVTSDGLILTNNHVIDVADEIKVELSTSRRQYIAKVVGKDPKTDVALIKIEATDLTPMVLADSDKTEVGDIVLAIGTPFGLAQTVTMGIVSAIGRNAMHIEGNDAYEDFIQTDAAINPGNSGGALVDAEGRMIGLNTAIINMNGGGGGNVGIGFAVPSNLARSVMESLLKDGHVTRGYLGVAIQEMTAELAASFKLPEITGALVGQVNTGTAAEQAGFKSGDVILEFNGKKIPNCSVLRLLVSETLPNTKCTAKIWRDGKEKMLEVTLKELTPDVAESEKKPGDENEQTPGEAPVVKALVEGVKVDELNVDNRHQINAPADLKGVVVVEVDPDASTFRSGSPGLQVGDVIVDVDKKPVTTVKEALEAVAASNQPSVLLRVWNRVSGMKDGSYRFVSLPRGK